ncbi:hypothetical protein, partial [Halomonas piscis]|uniref:hypothetical protein n=1 Tax=Halomonas piscis TaxID=3031727 RepID=UPI00289AD774
FFEYRGLTLFGITWHKPSCAAHSDIGSGEIANWTTRLTEGDGEQAQRPLSDHVRHTGEAITNSAR